MPPSMAPGSWIACLSMSAMEIANSDGNVNGIDTTKVERVIAGLDPSTPAADTNQDININASDITKVERIIIGLD